MKNKLLAAGGILGIIASIGIYILTGILISMVPWIDIYIDDTYSVTFAFRYVIILVTLFTGIFLSALSFKRNNLRIFSAISYIIGLLVLIFCLSFAGPALFGPHRMIYRDAFSCEYGEGYEMCRERYR